MEEIFLPVTCANVIITEKRNVNVVFFLYNESMLINEFYVKEEGRKFKFKYAN